MVPRKGLKIKQLASENEDNSPLLTCLVSPHIRQTRTDEDSIVGRLREEGRRRGHAAGKGELVCVQHLSETADTSPPANVTAAANNPRHFPVNKRHCARTA